MKVFLSGEVFLAVVRCTCMLLLVGCFLCKTSITLLISYRLDVIDILTDLYRNLVIFPAKV